MSDNELEEIRQKYQISEKKNKKQKYKGHQNKIDNLQEIFPQIKREKLEQTLQNFKGDQDKAVSYLCDKSLQDQPKIQAPVIQKLDNLFEQFSLNVNDKPKQPEHISQFIMKPEYYLLLKDDEEDDLMMIQQQLEEVLEPSQIDEAIMIECYLGLKNWIEEQGVYDVFEFASEEEKEFQQKLQAFIFDQIKLESSEQEFVMNESNFPPLKNVSPRNQNEFKVQNEEKIAVGFYFENKLSQPLSGTSCTNNSWEKPTNYKAYQATSSSSAIYIQKLCELFPYQSLDRIKQAFIEIGDFDGTSQFFQKQYDSALFDQPQTKSSKLSRGKVVICQVEKPNYYLKYDQNEFQRIRQEMSKLIVSKQLYNSYGQSTKDIVTRHKTANESNLLDAKINKLQNTCHQMFFWKVQQDGYFNLKDQIDLHGFRVSELQQVLPEVEKIIRVNYPGRKCINFNVGKGKISCQSIQRRAFKKSQADAETSSYYIFQLTKIKSRFIVSG